MTALAHTQTPQSVSYTADADSIDSGAGLEMFTSASMPHGCDMTAGGGVEMFTTSCTPAGSKAIQGDRVELFTTSC